MPLKFKAFDFAPSVLPEHGRILSLSAIEQAKAVTETVSDGTRDAKLRSLLVREIQILLSTVSTLNAIRMDQVKVYTAGVVSKTKELAMLHARDPKCKIAVLATTPTVTAANGAVADMLVADDFSPHRDGQVAGQLQDTEPPKEQRELVAKYRVLMAESEALISSFDAMFYRDAIGSNKHFVVEETACVNICTGNTLRNIRTAVHNMMLLIHSIANTPADKSWFGKVNIDGSAAQAAKNMIQQLLSRIVDVRVMLTLYAREAQSKLDSQRQSAMSSVEQQQVEQVSSVQHHAGQGQQGQMVVHDATALVTQQQMNAQMDAHRTAFMAIIAMFQEQQNRARAEDRQMIMEMTQAQLLRNTELTVRVLEDVIRHTLGKNDSEEDGAAADVPEEDDGAVDADAEQARATSIGRVRELSAEREALEAEVRRLEDEARKQLGAAGEEDDVVSTAGQSEPSSTDGRLTMQVDGCRALVFTPVNLRGTSAFKPSNADEPSVTASSDDDLGNGSPEASKPASPEASKPAVVATRKIVVRH